jgi:LCP family protein required for cell wall assembly
MDKKSVRKEKNHKKKPHAVSAVGSYWRWLVVGGITALAFSVGAASALLMAATPLKNGKDAFHLFPNHNGLSSIIPATLTKPVNILLLGIDNSGHPHQGKITPSEALAGNSDTMLLVRLVPNTHHINILSIPRDTQVVLPNYGIDKINDANVKGGAELAEKTVSHLLSNIAIDYYVRLDTEGFIHLVDALEGVEVNVPKPMHYVDETQHLMIDFQAGRQKLNGKHLQEYVRFRHDDLGDIGRVQRQQEVLKAIFRSALQPSTLKQLPQIIQVIKENVDTDLSVGAMLGITQFLSSSDSQCDSCALHLPLNLVMLPGRFSRPKEYPLSYWIENPEATAPILARYFNVSKVKRNAIANSTSSPHELRVAVLNATGKEEEGTKALLFLRKQGFENTYITNHEIDSTTIPLSETQIIAQRGDRDAAEMLKNTLGLGTVQVVSTGDIGSDVTVVVGTDWAMRN